MNSSTAAVCEGLSLFGFDGFKEKTEAARFAKDKRMNFKDRDRVYWIEHGRHLPRPNDKKKSRRGAAGVVEKRPNKRQQLQVDKKTLKKLLDL